MAVLLADQATKIWAVSALSDGERVTVVPGFLQFRLLYNPGAALSIGTEATWVFAVAAAVAAAGILYTARRLRSPAWTWGLGGLLGGAVSHLLDRLARDPGFGRGHVVDFIDYGGLFVGNVADIALTTSCAFVMFLSLRGIALTGERRDEPSAPPTLEPR
ncbi:signal peptidase II [Herbidospora solisilvae]|uniref:signal peptidase II n=1 Tax=Herbidospora solisilvae TaxID=2696284 RepID=UPI00192993AB|nr:signal peptidase II [Herbidospora solisilvae]